MKYVTHLKYPEWGVGRVLFENGDRADVEFKRGSVRFLLTELTEVEKPSVTSIINSGQKIQAELMLDIFRESSESPTRAELMQLGFGNPNAVIKALRDRGYSIETISMSKGSCKYRLLQ